MTNLASLLVWALVVHGLTQIVTVSRIARPIRESLLGSKFYVLHCPMCFGWWVGFGLSLAGLSPLAGLVSWPIALRALADGWAASAVAWAAHVALARIGANDL